MEAETDGFPLSSCVTHVSLEARSSNTAVTRTPAFPQTVFRFSSLARGDVILLISPAGLRTLAGEGWFNANDSELGENDCIILDANTACFDRGEQRAPDTLPIASWNIS